MEIEREMESERVHRLHRISSSPPSQSPCCVTSSGVVMFVFHRILMTTNAMESPLECRHILATTHCTAVAQIAPYTHGRGCRAAHEAADARPSHHADPLGSSRLMLRELTPSPGRILILENFLKPEQENVKQHQFSVNPK